MPAGRLKLREIPGFDSELIFYDRDESGGTRQCAYEIYRHQPSPELKGLLVAGLGELARVAKRREVHWLGRTKINLDMVEGLGEFIEFEVPVEDNTQAAESRIRELKEAFSITEDRTVGCSYSDLVGRSR